MTALPANGFFENNVRTEGEIKSWGDQIRDWLAQQPGGSTEATKVIAAGAVTPDIGIQAIDTEGAAASDDLDTIVTTNFPDGQAIMIRQAVAGRTIVVRHNQGGAGKILLGDAANLSLASTKMWLILKRTGADWEEIGRFYGDQKAAFRTYLGLGTAATQNTGTSGANVPLLNGANIHSGPQSIAALLDVQQDFRLSGDISPAQIVADTHDYNPAGLATASVLRLSTDATRQLTGLQGGADGRVMRILNVGSSNLDIITESASSTAANRFALGNNCNLTAGTGATFWYDTTSSRWRCSARFVVGASQADVEAAASFRVFLAPSNAHFHPGHPKAEVRFNGTGTLAIDHDYAISSVTDGGTGNYTPNFDTSFSGTTYGVVAATDISSGTTNSLQGMNWGTIAVGSFQIFTNSNTPALADSELNQLAWFGDL